MFLSVKLWLSAGKASASGPERSIFEMRFHRKICHVYGIKSNVSGQTFCRSCGVEVWRRGAGSESFRHLTTVQNCGIVRRSPPPSTFREDIPKIYLNVSSAGFR
ncbi:hypothetical protein AVEN_54519-1 [Araneus ventricosus]|uniref:Uncharacterized protein n=1 Tax=Araneus ventricosus TaxID=182803 RepID=A0A4Y2EHW3_ARAVE|nr:hypothetical protein AVEN_54519-1 [Araneus ventricosus]